MKRFFSMFLAFVMLFALVGCNADSETGETKAESPTESESETVPAVPQGAYVIADGEEAQYEIRYPEGDGVLLAAANVIARAVKTATGAELPVSSSVQITDRGVLQFNVAPETEAACILRGNGTVILSATTAEEAYCLALDLADALKASLAESGELYVTEALCEAVTEEFDAYDGALRIMTQNVRCADDGVGRTVVERAERFWKLVADYRPDIIGTQETTAQWNELLAANLGDEYAMVGVSRNGTGDKWDEWNTLLYRKDRFTLVDSGTFWLSETPTVPSTVAEGILNRICTWAVLEDKQTGERFTMANTHLDHTADERHRLAQVAVLCEFLEEMMARGPIYLTGDFNASVDSNTYWEVRTLLDDTREDAAANLSRVDYTYHAYGKTEALIDFCFYNFAESLVVTYEILDDQYEGYVSDHYGVLSVVVPRD